MDERGSSVTLSAIRQFSPIPVPFPDAENNWPLEPQYVPLHLATQALKVDRPPHRLFALHTYFNEIKTRDGLERLSKAGFDYADLFALEAKNWVFLGQTDIEYLREIKSSSEAGERLAGAVAHLETELKRTQGQIKEMAATRVWKLGNALRKLKSVFPMNN